MTEQCLADQRGDEERGERGESVTHECDEMRRQPEEEGKGGEAPLRAGESDRAKEEMQSM